MGRKKVSQKKFPALWPMVPTLWHELLPPPPGGEKLAALRPRQQAKVAVLVPAGETVFCKLAGNPVGGLSCLNRQQPACFGCAAKSHLCHACHLEPLALAEIELCAGCLELALAAEWERGDLGLEASRPVHCQRAKRQIVVRECQQMQQADAAPCAGCGQPSRWCEDCHLRPVRYAEDGRCLSCMVRKYGAPEHQALLASAAQRGRLDELIAARNSHPPAAPADTLPYTAEPPGPPRRGAPASATPVPDALVWEATVRIVEHCSRHQLKTIGRPWLCRTLTLSPREAQALWQRLRELPVLSRTNPPQLRLTTRGELERVLRPLLRLDAAAPAADPLNASRPPLDERCAQAIAVIRDSGKCGRIWLGRKLGLPEPTVITLQRQLEQLGVLGPDRGRPLGRQILKSPTELTAMLMPVPPAPAAAADVLPSTPPAPPELAKLVNAYLATVPVASLTVGQLSHHLREVAGIFERHGSPALAQLLSRAAEGSVTLAQILGHLERWQPPSSAP